PGSSLFDSSLGSSMRPRQDAALGGKFELPRPTDFGPAAEPLRVVLACSFDPVGLSGPLSVWLERLVGLPVALQYVGFGAVLDALRDNQSAWIENGAGVNAFVGRLVDLEREAERAGEACGFALEPRGSPLEPSSCALPWGGRLLAAALGGSRAAREGRTVVVLAPPPEALAPGAVGAEAAACLASRGAEVPTGTARRIRAALAGCRGVCVADEAEALQAVLG
ncbi:unnamed protein product, partial [Prorocentrum cordatum]